MSGGARIHLPPKWVAARIGDICDAVNGRAFKSTEWRNDGLPIIRIQNLKDAGAAFNYFDAEIEDRYRVERGDLLFAWSGTPGTSFGAFIWAGPPGVLNQHIFNLRFDDEVVDRRYFAYALNESVRHFIQQAQGGVGLAHITKSKFVSSKVPLAPRSEQTRIVEAIDTQLTRLDAAVAALERVKANLKRYRASVLKAAVEGRLVPTEAELARKEGRDYEPASVVLERILKERRRRWEEAELAAMKAKGKTPKDDGWRGKYKEPAAPDTTGLPDLPEGWCWASLEALTDPVRVVCYGILMPKQHVEDGVPYVKVKDMRGDLLDVASLNRTARAIADKYARASLKEGDLLLAIRGTYGRVVEVPAELEGGNITQDTARLALHADLRRRYVAIALRSDDLQMYFKRVARGVAVKGVNIGDVRPAPIPLAPLAEQDRVISEVDRLLSIEDRAETTIASNETRSERLRQSVLRWAFEGRFVDQDSSDEPASVLLERIRNQNPEPNSRGRMRTNRQGSHHATKLQARRIR